MSLAFWRRKKSTPDAPGSGSSRNTADSDDSGRSDPTAAVRARARRRLIGAAALLLLVVVVVPMVLDPEPKPVADSIPIDIPSEKTKFSPRLALPPVPAPDNVPLAPPPDAAPTSAPSTKPMTPAEAAPSPIKRTDAKSEVSKQATGAASASKTEVARSGTTQDSKADADKLPSAVKGGKFAVQATATSTEAAAREFSERLKKSGFASYTERTETPDGTRFRVRVGPYASREDAERARARLKGIGVNGNIVGT